mmetsp:Transcript_17469/g.29283  ORF Transcript_17469/g.29283 Transcript_17469/m.29283 type:complete len:250 (-) Transcript_17469:1271-2020(-)
MIGAASFVTSVLLSRVLFQSRDTSRPTAKTESDLIMENSTRISDCDKVKTNSEACINSCCEMIGQMSKSKKRKLPLTSRETRSEGELEAAEDAFASSLATLKSLSNNDVSTISPQFIAAQKTFKAAKTTLHKLKKKKLATSVDPPSWSQYPLPCTIPREENDSRFTQSFDIKSFFHKEYHSSDTERLETEQLVAKNRKEAQQFFDMYGFVVFSNVLSPSECSATECEIWVMFQQYIYIYCMSSYPSSCG